MAKGNTPSAFLFQPRVSVLAIALIASGAHAAEERAVQDTATLPEVKVKSERESADSYNVKRASSEKFTAPLLDTPKSITVLTEALIRDQGATTFEQALRSVPGVTFGAGEGGTPINDRPFIRGYDSSSSTFVDGLRDLGSQAREIFNTETIEVLKGPSGAFDGRGSGGGSINIVSKTPKAENFVRGSVGLGTDQYKRGTLDVNYLLSDDVAVRVNAMAHDADVPGRDAVDTKRWGFAPSIIFGLNTPTSLTLSYYKLKTDDMPDYGLPLTAPNQGVQRKPVSGVDKDNFYGLKNRDFRETEVDAGTATIKHAFSDNVNFRNVTRYAVSKNDYVVTNPDDSQNNVARGQVWRSSKTRNSRTETFGNLSEVSFKFETAEIKHSANAGFEFSHEETTNTPYAVSNLDRNCNTAGMFTSYTCTSLYNPNPSDPWTGTVTKGLTTTETRTQTKSFYAFDSAEIGQNWIVNLGLRRDIYSTDASTLNRANSNPVPTKFDNDAAFWNYQAGLVYKIQPNASVYIAQGTSSTPSGASNGDGTENLSAANLNLKPERTKNYEIGVKWDVLSNLSLTSAIFYTKKDNARVTLTSGTTMSLDGEQKIKGFELGFSGAITPAWQVFGGYTYLDSELVNNGPRAVDSANNNNEFPGIAKNSATVWTTYNVNEKWTLGGGANYMDSVYANVANTITLPSYTRFDAMTSYKIDKNLSLQLNVLNLTDKRYFDKTFTTHFATVAAGRSAMLQLLFNY